MQVSWSSHALRRVHLVPGSAEQRGVDMALALAGAAPFTRPLAWGDASLVAEVQVEAEQPEWLEARWVGGPPCLGN